MYYAHDNCLNMFSKDQRARMRACLHHLRSKLVSSSNLAFTGVNCKDLPIKCNSCPDVPLAFTGVDYNDLQVNKPALEKKIIISPNPTNSIVHIIYHDLAVKKDMSIRVYNQMGQMLKEVHSHTAINELSLVSFPEGVDYITMTIDNVSVTKYIIKANSNNLFFDR
jgi:hypothetical protein